MRLQLLRRERGAPARLFPRLLIRWGRGSGVGVGGCAKPLRLLRRARTGAGDTVSLGETRARRQGQRRPAWDEARPPLSCAKCTLGHRARCPGAQQVRCPLGECIRVGKGPCRREGRPLLSPSLPLCPFSAPVPSPQVPLSPGPAPASPLPDPAGPSRTSLRQHACFACWVVEG